MMPELVLVTYLWFAANGNICVAGTMAEVPAGVKIVTEERVVARDVDSLTRLQLRAAREIRLAVEHCPRPKDREA